MIINSVRLKNFKSHSDTKINFGAGINVILGENGAGKTSVLEAISFALFKEYGGNLEDLVRRGQSEMSVSLDFTSHGRHYKVVRIRKKNSTDSNLFLVEGEEKLLQSGDSDVDREIAGILGIDRYLFTNAVYVRQGEIARLLIARPAEKKQLIGRLLGIDVLEKVWDKMRIVIDFYKEKKTRLEVRIMEEDRIKEQLSETEKELLKADAGIRETSREISEISESMRKAENEEKLLREVEKKYVQLSESLDSAKTSLGREKERLDSVKEQAAEISKAKRELLGIQKKLAPGWRPALNRKITKNRDKISEIDGEIGTLRGRVGEIKEIEDKLKHAGSKCPLCGSKLTEKHRLNLLQERGGIIANISKETDRLVKEKGKATLVLESLEGQLDDLNMLEHRYSELTGIASRYENFMKSMQDSERIVRELKERVVSLEKKLGSISQKRQAYEKVKDKVQDLRSEVSLLREESGRHYGIRQELLNSHKRLEDEIKGILENKREHDRLAKFVSLLTEIRGLFDKSGLQKDLRMRSGPVIEEYMREFFREFNFDYSDLSLDENYDITLYGTGGESTTEMLSGGEKIAAALAMRLGIARVLVGSSAESMLLDEPTIFLDTERRQDLIEVLKKLSVMPQLIVVTHDPSLEDAADRINFVKKERGASFVE